MSNYTKTNIGNEGRAELHETLSLTGAEVSINSLPAGASPVFRSQHHFCLEVKNYRCYSEPLFQGSFLF